MITAKEAFKITESAVKSEVGSQLFNYAMKQIENSIKTTAHNSGRTFSYNINALSPSGRPSLSTRKAVSAELKKNGYSYCEFHRSTNNIWFTVSW